MAPSVREVRVDLDDPNDLFHLAPVDEFSEYRNHLTGIEYALSELKRVRLGPVRLVVGLPPEKATVEDLPERISAALGRYCRNRRRYNENEIVGMRRDGAGATFVGMCILAIGLFFAEALRRTDLPELVTIFFADGIFLVVAWVGLWYPLDTLVYSPRVWLRENKVLDALTEAEVVVVPTTASPNSSL